MDQVGTPDFVSGAMENWGLITYRETALLYNDGAAAAKKRAATVIAHELAHMWFGNIITCEWWSATWLNEGFASYFQFLVTDPIEPNWFLMDQIVIDQLHSALALDSDRSSKPITHRVRSPADAIASFGSLTYSKGGSFLRMLSYIIKESNLKKALQTYVGNNAYGSATPDDLFVELEPYASQAGLESDEMLEFLRSWTEQPGYPLLYVTRHYNGTGRVTVAQKRFLEPNDDIAPQLYYVPLTWVEDGGVFDEPILKGFLSNRERSKELSGFKDDGWLIFNTQQMGYFRVMYDDENFERLAAKLSTPTFSDIHWLNRAQLLDDAFVLARARRISFEQLLRLTDYLPRENEYTPWAAALAGFASLDRLLASHVAYPRFQAYVLSLVSTPYSTLGFAQREWQTEKLLVAAVTARACAMGSADCRRRAAQLLQDDLDGGVRVAADVRGAVYCHGVRHSPDNYWDTLWNRFNASQDEAERALLLTGLGCSSNPQKLNLFLEYTVNNRGVRKQEGASAFSAVYATQVGADVTLDFLHKNYEQTRQFLGSVNSVVSGLANRLVTYEHRDSLRSLVASRWWDGLASTGEAALKAVDRNLEWLEGNSLELMLLIDERAPTEPPPTEAPTTTTEAPRTEAPTEAPPEETTSEEPSTTPDSASVSVASYFLVLLAACALLM